MIVAIKYTGNGYKVKKMTGKRWCGKIIHSKETKEEEY